MRATAGPPGLANAATVSSTVTTVPSDRPVRSTGAASVVPYVVACGSRDSSLPLTGTAATGTAAGAGVPAV